MYSPAFVFVTGVAFFGAGFFTKTVAYAQLYKPVELKVGELAVDAIYRGTYRRCTAPERIIEV
jgi:hypothetical protein